MLYWSGSRRFSINGTQYVLRPEGGGSSTDDRFVLRKSRQLVEYYVGLASEFEGANVVELGVNEGGSTAFLAQILRPRRLVALEIESEPNEPLAEFVEVHGLGTVVRPRYGADQANPEQLEAVLEENLGDERIDLVVDDASHNLPETIASFNVLFPRLRPGGAFVIEDWMWDQQWERAIRTDPATRAQVVEAVAKTGQGNRVGLTRMVLELVLAVGYSPEIVSDVAMQLDVVRVGRGPAEIDRAPFTLDSCYAAVGRNLLT